VVALAEEAQDQVGELDLLKLKSSVTFISKGSVTGKVFNSYVGLKVLVSRDFGHSLADKETAEGAEDADDGKAEDGGEPARRLCYNRQGDESWTGHVGDE
jgi:hypothetical protein